MNGSKYLFIFMYLLAGTMCAAPTSADWNSLIKAIEVGDLATVKKIVPSKISPDATTKNGRSLIQIAQFHNNPTIIKYFEQKLEALPIEFYEKTKPYYEFTNFYQCTSIKLGGKSWPTSEHYFQAMKFIGPNQNIQEIIRTAPTARDVFDLANSKNGTYKNLIRADWDLVKDDIMLEVIRAKFSQDDNFKKLLLSTGSRELIEASPVDAYWGYGPDKKGKNMLGKILMQVRNELDTDLKVLLTELHNDLNALIPKL